MVCCVLAALVYQRLSVKYADLPVDACGIVGKRSSIAHYPHEGIIGYVHGYEVEIGEFFSGHSLDRDSR